MAAYTKSVGVLNLLAEVDESINKQRQACHTYLLRINFLHTHGAKTNVEKKR